jgi:hypothetical protein
MSDSSNNYPRRKFLTRTAGGIGLASAFPWIDQLARAQQADEDEHFFIFVELSGGAHFMLATDARDPSQLPLEDKSRCLPFSITDQVPTLDDYERWQKDSNESITKGEGHFIIQPYIGDMTSSYKIGKTSYTVGGDSYQGRYALGPSGLMLEPLVNEMAVIRGVRMRGTFHPKPEIFTGIQSGGGRHIAGSLAKILQEDRRYGGPKLLDNAVFEAATTGVDNSQLTLRTNRMDGQSLASLVGFLGTDASSKYLFNRAQKLTEALSRGAISAEHRNVLASYITALGDGPSLAEQLKQLMFLNEDYSLNLEKQFQAALTLIQSGLSRVVTLCLGAPNGMNGIGGFGLFDAHSGVFHPGSNSTAETEKHHLQVEKAMNQIANFLKVLKSTKYKRSNKSLFDVTTVVVSSDHARTSNLAGNEETPEPDYFPFGNGHNWRNNNYIMFGKGVQGGAWIGENDLITQWANFVDFSSLNTPDVSRVLMPTAIDGEGTYTGEGRDTGNLRTFMVKDIMKTIFAMAGHESKFEQYYSETAFAEAQTISPVVKGRF